MRRKDPEYKKQELINMVVEWSLDGKPQAEMRKFFNDLEYSHTYFYDILREAKVLINTSLVDIAKNRLESTIIEMETQYYLALEDKDRKLANDIRKEINKISGLHQQNLDITTGGDKLTDIKINIIRPDGN